MSKIFIFSIIILLLISVIQTQGQSEPINDLPSEEKPQFSQQQSIAAQPISVDPIIVNPDPQNTNDQTNEVQAVTENQVNDEIKIQPQTMTNTEEKEPIEVQKNGEPDLEKKINKEIDITGQDKLVEENKSKMEIARQIQAKRVKQVKEKSAKKPEEVVKVRSQKYQAEQKRIEQLRERQKAYEEERKKQMQATEKEEYDPAPKMSESQRVRSEQIEKIRQIRDNEQEFLTSKAMLFEIDNQIQQYLIRPSVNMKMILRFTVYVENKNIYGLIPDIAKTQPLKIFVYEDNSRIVGQAQCFYEAAIKLNTKANSVYSVRAYNAGGPKLISFSYPNFLTSEVTSKLLSEEKGNDQMEKAKSSIFGILLNMKKLQEARVLDVKNANFLRKSMKRYYQYHIIQIVVFVVLCFIQIFFIKNLFKNQSIL